MATTQGIKLDDETQARLKRLGNMRDRSPHWLMKDAIEKYLEQAEHYEQGKLEDMARWESYVTTGKFIDGSMVEKKLDELSKE